MKINISENMRPPVLLITIFLFIGCTDKIDSKGPDLPLVLPETLTVLMLDETIEKGKIKQSQTVFISNGKKWRAEIAEHKDGRKPTVIIHDGVDYFSTRLTDSKELQKLDIRLFLKKGYRNFSKSNYVGLEQIGSAKCWYFSNRDDETLVEFWIDVDKRIPIKFQVNLNGFSSNVGFYDMPGNTSLDFERLFMENMLDPEFLGKEIYQDYIKGLWSQWADVNNR